MIIINKKSLEGKFMGDFVEIARIDELSDEEMKMFSLEGREILLARSGDNYYCTDNRCPHMGGNEFKILLFLRKFHSLTGRAFHQPKSAI